MPWQRSNVDLHILNNLDERYLSPYVQFSPTLYAFGYRKGENMQKLGTPKTSTVWGGAMFTPAQLKTHNASSLREIRIQDHEPDDGDTLDDRAMSTPVASEFASDNVGSCVNGYTIIQEPLRIPTDDLEDAQSPDAVGNCVDNWTNPVQNRFVKRFVNEIWNGSPTEAQQNKRLWKHQMGIKHQLTANNRFGRVDRSQHQQLNPMEINAATDLQSVHPDLTLVRKVNHGFRRHTSQEVVPGLAGKSENGVGCTVFMTTAILWQDFADQADGRYQIHVTGIPGHAIGGFKHPIIQFDNVFIMYDPDCPAGEIYGFNLDTWTVEVHRQNNFVFTGLRDASEIEGGGRYQHGTFRVKFRQTCDRPWLNFRGYGFEPR